MSGAAQPIFVLDVAADDAVAAELCCPIEECHVQEYLKVWRPAMAKLRDKLGHSGISKDQLPQSGHWNWATKIDQVDGILDFRSFCVTVGNANQGMMRTDSGQRARIDSQAGDHLIYVDYLEVAPWNCSYHGSPVTYRGIGTVLVQAAIDLSLDDGFKGRIGLHSLPQSDQFYAKLGMTDLGPDAKCQNLRYFEMTPEQAKACRQGVTGP